LATFDIAHQRLRNQHLSTPTFTAASEVVGWLGAVQAQDYLAAKWALSLRMANAVDDDIERAFSDGAILRTHVMRPTWHFVTPADIRWLLALTAPRVHAVNATMYRQRELDPQTFKRSNAALVKALQGGIQLTRVELRAVLERARVATGDTLRMSYLMMRAELDGIICSGARRGKQSTYQLLAGSARKSTTLARDEALAELKGRYFTSHGPATVQDFAWWSGLTLADVRSGIEMVGAQLSHEEYDGQIYWFAATTPPPTAGKSQWAYLLPNYDEYTISYRDHSGVFDPANLSNLIFSHMIVIAGRIAGTWKRTLTKNTVMIETNTFMPLSNADQRAVTIAAQRYGAFLGMPVVMA